MNITMVTGVWKRPEVFALFARGVHNLNADIRVIVAGSEGAPSRTMVEDQGFEYIEIANQPLATKMNATTLAARGSDYVICMGSDDILSPELFDEYRRLMDEGWDFIGVTDFYFYDLTTRKALYWGGYREPYRKGHTCGAGRCISKGLMDAWDWKPWKVGDDLMLDNSMQGRIRGSVKTFSLKESGLMALDIKSSTNMTPFEKWDNAYFIDPKIITDTFTL